jgi:GNAT superfamily N-acetyltransferase
MLFPALVNTTEELQQILSLQKENLARNIDEDEMNSQGFVTLRHNLPVLEKMHRLAPSIIIKDNEQVVAYALTMLKECRSLIPDLESMFSLFEKISWQNKALIDYRYYVMGQVCIAKSYRGQGLFEKLYAHHRKIYHSQFDLLLTEVSFRNKRSLRAHEKVGFKIIYTQKDALDEWAILAWDWK